MKKILILLFVGLISALAVKSLFFSDKLKGGNGSGEEAGSEIEQKVLTFEIDGKTSKGVKQWHLEGKAAEFIGQEILLEDLNATVYGDKFTVYLSSDNGKYIKDKSIVELEGNVEFLSDEGVKLTTEKAEWSHLTKEVNTDAEVFIFKDDMKAKGLGAKANSEEKWAILQKNVTVEMEPDTIITCDGRLEARFEESIAIFHDNVKVTDKEGQLFADLLTVYVDNETNKISKVVAEGNVKLRKGDSYTISDKAIYTDGTSSVEFLGKPRIVIAPQELEGTGFDTESGGTKRLFGD